MEEFLQQHGLLLIGTGFAAIAVILHVVLMLTNVRHHRRMEDWREDQEDKLK